MKSTTHCARAFVYSLVFAVVLSACGGADEALVDTTSVNATGSTLDSAAARRWRDTLPNGRTFQAQTAQTASTSSTPTTSQDTVTIADSSTYTATATTVANASTVPVAATIAEPAPTSPSANSVDTIVNDMKLLNDAELAGMPQTLGFAKRAIVGMGANPRGTGTPDYWQPSNQSYKSSAYWYAMLPWMVIYDGVGNAARNTRVELSNIKAYYRSHSSGAWIMITQGPIDGQNFLKDGAQGAVVPTNLRRETSSTMSVLPPGGNSIFHGWGGGKTPIVPSDISAVYLTLKARLILNDPMGVDDRAAARYMVNVGGDYYPTTSTTCADFAPMGYCPTIGISRAKLITADWQSISMTSVDTSVGNLEPNGISISEQELRSLPPPLE